MRQQQDERKTDSRDYVLVFGLGFPVHLLPPLSHENKKRQMNQKTEKAEKISHNKKAGMKNAERQAQR